MVERFVSVFGLVQVGGLQLKIEKFGGCFAFCQQRTSARLSTHSWGSAIDLNPGTNALARPEYGHRVMEIFRGAGFEWVETGQARGAMQCIFSFVRHIES